jgi:thiamine kinase-like enzyme
LLNEIKGYRRVSPRLFEDKDLKRFMPKIKEYLKSKRELFLPLKKFSLCHKDPCLTNTLLTKDGLRYIDWEWASYWDNALDVAMFFDPNFPQYPWKIKLSGKRRDYFLNQYLKIIKDKTLKERVKVWQDYMIFTDLMFFKWKLLNYDKKTSDLPKKLYAEHKKICVKSLTKMFQREGLSKPKT